MKVEIKKYSREHKEECLAAFNSNTPTSFNQEEVSLFEDFIDGLISNKTNEKYQEETYYYVIYLEGKIIGCGGFGHSKKNNSATLAWGLIHIEFQKQGFGDKLLIHRLKQIKRLYPKSRIILDTSQFSYTFFERYGFVTTQITKEGYAEGLDRYDMVLGQ